MTTTYVWRKGNFVDKKTGEPMPIPERDGLCVPLAIIPDVQAHVAPTGDIINTRSDRRELRKRHGLIPYERLTDRPRGYMNEKFCAKRGLKPCEETQEHFKRKRKEAFAKAGLSETRRRHDVGHNDGGGNAGCRKWHHADD